MDGRTKILYFVLAITLVLFLAVTAYNTMVLHAFSIENYAP